MEDFIIYTFCWSIFIDTCLYNVLSLELINYYLIGDVTALAIHHYKTLSSARTVVFENNQYKYFDYWNCSPNTNIITVPLISRTFKLKVLALIE